MGLLEPLIVYPQGDNYEILDGCLRYRILLDWGVETVPCLIGRQREAFTGNRMVNQLSLPVRNPFRNSLTRVYCRPNQLALASEEVITTTQEFLNDSSSTDITVALAALNSSGITR